MPVLYSQKRKIGPIEHRYAESSDPQLWRLTQMSNTELLTYMDELVEAGENFNEALYDAAERLLDERAPIELPSEEEVAQSWENFKRNHPEIFETGQT